LAGGLNPGNVAEILAQYNAGSIAMVDVSSGVEGADHKQDLDKIKKFVVAAKTAHRG